MAAVLPTPGSIRAISDPKSGYQTAEDVVELSVVIPCLNEAETIGLCIDKAMAALEAHHIAGEVVIGDNGSTDGSQAIAAARGARVVSVTERGYGAALLGGIAAARGRYVIMGDADDSYDFGEIPRFVTKLREGYDLVQGCRLPSGGGTVSPNAMPFLHRWWGNPMFSALARWWFRAPIHDIHCGMRGFVRELPERLGQTCTGMEFASEMVIKASLARVRTAEVPITLHEDGRTAHAPHLRTFRDGWRHLRFFLVFSPRWLFLVPGRLLTLFGLLGYAAALPMNGLRIRGVHFDVNTLLVASLSIILGFQAISFALMTKIFAIDAGLLPADRRVTRFSRVVTLERSLVAGGLAVVAGLSLLVGAVAQWKAAGFGPLNYERTMRWVIPGTTLTALGVQVVLSSFFVSVLLLRRRRDAVPSGV
jgi:glycosyltransferase involved in cell wall biosynthesis